MTDTPEGEGKKHLSTQTPLKLYSGKGRGSLQAESIAKQLCHLHATTNIYINFFTVDRSRDWKPAAEKEQVLETSVLKIIIDVHVRSDACDCLLKHGSSMLKKKPEHDKVI